MQKSYACILLSRSKIQRHFDNLCETLLKITLQQGTFLITSEKVKMVLTLES